MVKEERHESDVDKKIKKESDLKKFLRKRSFLYLMCAVVFVVFFVPDMIAPSDLDKKLAENFDTSLTGLGDEVNQKIALDIIKSYRGTDDDGYTLFELIIESTENQYPTVKIMKHSDTILEFNVKNVSLDYIDKIPSTGWYEVKLTFETFDDLREYIWNVNIETEKIIPVNDGARKTMNVVDSFD